MGDLARRLSFDSICLISPVPLSSIQWEAKGKDIVAEMVQRYRLWRSRGEELCNPFEEDDANHDVYGIPSPPLSHERLRRNDNDTIDDDDDDDDDDGSIVEA